MLFIGCEETSVHDDDECDDKVDGERDEEARDNDDGEDRADDGAHEPDGEARGDHADDEPDEESDGEDCGNDDADVESPLDGKRNDGANDYHKSLPTEPAITVHYNCLTKITDVEVEWVGVGIECLISFLSINLDKINQSKCLWTLCTDKIEAAKKKLEFDRHQLYFFNNAISECDRNTTYLRNSDRLQLFFILDFVENSISADGIELILMSWLFHNIFFPM